MRLLLLIFLVGAAGAWFATAPRPLPDDALAGLEADAEAGEIIFAAAGCASCHLAPEVTEGEGGEVLLPGGRRFESAFGTFIAPNISTDAEHGIGAWTDVEIASAIMRGVSPEGQHYYPAFPYTSYARAEMQDVADLIAYLRTLPADSTPSLDHEVGFPFNIRRSLGGWKLLFARGNDWVITGDLTAEEERGRYLAEALGHCGECHTPRNALGGSIKSRWLAGAENPSGEGTIPGLTPAQLGWSAGEIAEYLKSGFTPDFDTAGGEMVDVITNTAQLTDADRAAIGAYIAGLPDAE